MCSSAKHVAAKKLWNFWQFQSQTHIGIHWHKGLPYMNCSQFRLCSSCGSVLSHNICVCRSAIFIPIHPWTWMNGWDDYWKKLDV